MALPDVVVDWYTGTLNVLGLRAVLVCLPSLLQLDELSSGIPPGDGERTPKLASMVGHATGLEIARASLAAVHGDLNAENKLQATLEILRRTGWGDIRLGRANWDDNEFRFVAENLPLGSMVKTRESAGRPVDAIVVGLLSGALESIVGRRMRGSEVTCQAAGGSECSIVITLDRRAQP